MLCSLLPDIFNRFQSLLFTSVFHFGVLLWLPAARQRVCRYTTSCVDCRTMKEKVVEEEEVDWGQLKKVTVEGEEAKVVEEVMELKKVEQEAAPQLDLGPRRQSVLVRALS